MFQINGDPVETAAAHNFRNALMTDSKPGAQTELIFSEFFFKCSHGYSADGFKLNLGHDSLKELINR